MSNFSKSLNRFIVFPLIFAISGCASIRGPRLPKAFVITKDQDQLVVDEVDRYNKGLCIYDSTKACPEQTRQERDQIIYNLKLIIDRNYQDYAKGFQETEDTSTFAGEVIGATLSGTAGIVGQVATKDMLSLASTLTQSTSTSAQKNFYQKQTSYAVVVVMDSQRAEKWSYIFSQLTAKDVKDYSLAAALSDLLDYRQQGTALQALASIQKNAGKVDQKAKDSIDVTAKVPVVK